MQEIQRISSNWTLFLKIFFPTFWFVFYGAVVIAIFAMPQQQMSLSASLKYGVLIFYLSGSLVIYFTLLNLKRVEYDKDFLYVTNYFKTVRVPWPNVETLQEKRILFVRVGYFKFKNAITFGKWISFVESRSLMRHFKAAHPEKLK